MLSLLLLLLLYISEKADNFVDWCKLIYFCGSLNVVLFVVVVVAVVVVVVELLRRADTFCGSHHSK